jgi:uncharacterized membrane protein YkgB
VGERVRLTGVGAVPEPTEECAMNSLIKKVGNSALFKSDFDYHLVRASMVLIYLLFGYQKWFEYEAENLVPFIGVDPLISWMYPAFGHRGASWVLGVSEWVTCALLIWGFWNKKVGILGALLSIGTFLTTCSIIPFTENGWDQAAGGFPAMTGQIPFLMKDVVLLAVSFYLLKQDLVRTAAPEAERPEWREFGEHRAWATDEVAAK